MSKTYVFPAYAAGSFNVSTQPMNAYKQAPKTKLVRRQEVHTKPRVFDAQSISSNPFMSQIAQRGLCIDLQPAAKPNLLRRQPSRRAEERPVTLARHHSAPAPPPVLLYKAAPLARTVSAPGPAPGLRRRNEVRVREPDARRVLASRRI